MSTIICEYRFVLNWLQTCWVPKSLLVLFLLALLESSNFPGHSRESDFPIDNAQKSTTPFQASPLPSLFVHQPKALQEYRPIAFQEEWINDFNTAPHDSVQDFGPNHTIISPPKSLPVPHFVEVYHLARPNQSSVPTLARQARQIIDQILPRSGAVLFRNLHAQIHNASDFAVFWNHVVQGTSTTKQWHPMTDHLSCYNRKRERPVQGVDRVDTDVPSFTIGCHNEHSCNPRPSDKIFFYALHPAVKGGESLLRRNQDIVVPAIARKLVSKAGGLQFTRSYPSKRQLQSNKHTRHPTEMSWQERTQTQQHAQAREYFAKQHRIFNVSFDDQDTLTAHAILPGFLDRKGEQWFNRIDYGFPVELADGSIFPLDLQSHLKRQKWHETSAVKLQQGDWLVLDNRRVQHGRLPYRDIDGHPSRQLLVTYTSPSS